MTQKRTHTWDLVTAYHRCPHCDYIIESRSDYQYQMGLYRKIMECPRCHASFTLIKKHHIQPGPLFGEPDHTEFTWG